ncbi:hypothetical protein R6Q57_007581 [Mikania cordata]
MSWWDGDFFFGQYSDVSRVSETYQMEISLMATLFSDIHFFEEMMAWVTRRALDNVYVVVTGRSKKKKGTDEVNKIWLVCDHGGEHNSTAILRRTGSKKSAVLLN